MKDIDMNEELLIRFLTHTCSTEELKQVDNWIASNKVNADWLFEMERIWSLKGELRFSDKQEIEKAYRQFISRISKKTLQLKYRTYFYSVLKYVAIILVVSLLSINLYKMLTPQEPELMNEICVPRGERANVTLSDGTKVSLNSDTKFTYPSHFSKSSRNVSLIGEGYFEVTHNPQKPFIVNAQMIHVKVLGTKFNMRTYSGENSIVTLSEGKVEVESSNKENKITLHPNEEATYSESAGMSISKGINVGISKSWTKGELAFMDQSLSIICKAIERKFNVKIVIADRQLAVDVFTCHFKESATIEEVMTLLKETRKLNYSFKEGKIVIYKSKNSMPMGKV